MLDYFYYLLCFGNSLLSDLLLRDCLSIIALSFLFIFSASNILVLISDLFYVLFINIYHNIRRYTKLYHNMKK
jgi:hypothetical protein